MLASLKYTSLSRGNNLGMTVVAGVRNKAEGHICTGFFHEEMLRSTAQPSKEARLQTAAAAAAIFVF